MMNRHQRRAEAARERKRADLVRFALDYLARAAAPTATGCTLILPDGSTTYVSAADARAMRATGKPGGIARRSARGGRA